MPVQSFIDRTETIQSINSFVLPAQAGIQFIKQCLNTPGSAPGHAYRASLALLPRGMTKIIVLMPLSENHTAAYTKGRSQMHFRGDADDSEDAHGKK